MKVESFTCEQAGRVLYAMAGDDCSLHHDLAALTPKQQVDHRENQILTCALQLALIGLGKASDQVALAVSFGKNPSSCWSTTECCSRAWAWAVSSDNLQYHDLDSFYQALAARNHDVDLINLYMVGGGNAVLRQDAGR